MLIFYYFLCIQYTNTRTCQYQQNNTLGFIILEKMVRCYLRRSQDQVISSSAIMAEKLDMLIVQDRVSHQGWITHFLIKAARSSAAGNLDNLMKLHSCTACTHVTGSAGVRCESAKCALNIHFAQKALRRLVL